MKQNRVLYFGFFLVISFLISISFNSSAIALSRDCGIYESIYKGITCRNASFEDTPICDDNEDVLNSPKTPKLCCCERLLEPVNNNNENGGLGTKEKFNSCKDFNCQPGTEGERTKKCSKGFISTSAYRDENDLGITCCCPINQTTYTEPYCRAIGCADTLPSFATTFGFSGSAPTGPPPGGPPQQPPPSCADNLTPTTIETTVPYDTIPLFGGSSNPGTVTTAPPPNGNSKKYACCCPGIPNFENVTCKLAIGCEENSQLGQCDSNQQLVDPVTVRKQGDETAGQTLSCCCKSSNN